MAKEKAVDIFYGELKERFGKYNWRIEFVYAPIRGRGRREKGYITLSIYLSLFGEISVRRDRDISTLCLNYLKNYSDKTEEYYSIEKDEIVEQVKMATDIITSGLLEKMFNAVWPSSEEIFRAKLNNRR